MEVIGEGQFIIENVDGINESVNDLALIVGIVDVSKLETGNPIYDLGLGVARPPGYFHFEKNTGGITDVVPPYVLSTYFSVRCISAFWTRRKSIGVIIKSNKLTALGALIDAFSRFFASFVHFVFLLH